MRRAFLLSKQGTSLASCRSAPDAEFRHRRLLYVQEVARTKRRSRQYRRSVFEERFTGRRLGGLSHGKSERSALVAASASAASTASAAAPGDFVRVHYTGTLEDGMEFDSSKGREPLEFVVGNGAVIAGFDHAVTGLGVGSSRKHVVKPEHGYGEWREEKLAKIPKQDLKLEFELEPGTRVRLGNGLEAVVHEVTSDNITIDTNSPMAGKTLHFDVELIHLTKGGKLEAATFGAGCFWGPELLFARVPGVVSTRVGYSQGTIEQPSYDDVCSGLTGHNEVVQVTYDPSELSYKSLLDAFMKGHNPTQANGQGNDLGSQYRSGIYYHTPEQKAVATEYLQQVQGNYEAPIATECEELQNYYEAEAYHQQYLVRGGRFGRPQSDTKGCQDPIRCYG